MPNTHKNKVVYNGIVLIDLTEDTVTPSALMQGYTAHDASGAPITGTATGGGTEAGTVTQDAQGYLVLDDEAPSGRVTVEALSVTQNGTYTAPTGKAYSPVTVNVANSYTSSDEGKVVSNGALVAQTAMASSITANGTYDTTTNNSVTVNVSSGGGLEYEEGTVTVPTDTTTNYAIQFSDTHTKLPSYYYIALVSNYAMTKTSVSVAFSLTESAGAVADENYNKSYGTVARAYIGDSTYTSPIVTRLMYPSSDTGNSSIYYPRYWATESQITLPASANYKAGGTYKWMAVWE